MKLPLPVLVAVLTVAACEKTADTTTDSGTTDTDPGSDTTTDPGSDTTDPGSDTTDPGSDTTEPAPTYQVSGTLTGLTHSAVTVALDGVPLQVSADGTFTFPAELEDGAPYEVTLVVEPSCPALACDLANGTGTIAGADATGVTVTCREPQYRMVTYSWGDRLVRVADDIQSLADGAAATPRVVTPDPLPPNEASVDGLVIDYRRDLVYIGVLGEVLVFEGLATLDGTTAPARTFTLPYVGTLSLSMDVEGDRLFAADTSNNLYVVDAASTRSGAVVPTATIPLAGAQCSAYDPVNDRLYVERFRNQQIAVFDNASTLTSSSTPDRAWTWDDTTGPDWTRSLAIDPCTDRLYVASNVPTPDGATITAFDGASTLDGPVDFDQAGAQFSVTGVLPLTLDGSGRMYSAEDSATALFVFDDPTAWTGSANVADTTWTGLVNKSYSVDVARY